MKAPDRKSQIKVGLFFCLGIALLAFSIIVFGGGMALLTPKKTAYINFPQTQGLANGAIVTLAGLPIGNVNLVELSDNTADVRVRLSIEARYFGRLTDSAIASIRTQGALGDKYIYIDPMGATGAPLMNKGTIERDPQPDFFELISERSSDLSVAADLMKEMNVLFKNLNDNNRSALLMENLIGASHNFGRVMNDPELKSSIKHLNSVLRKIDSGEGTLGLLVNDHELHSQVSRLFGDSPRNKYLRPLIRESIRQGENKKP